eukprot:s1244_g7.t1
MMDAAVLAGGGDGLEAFRIFRYLPYEGTRCQGRAGPWTELCWSSDHTDWGSLTLIAQPDDGQGALELFSEGEYHRIAPFPGALLVNGGDTQLENGSTSRTCLENSCAASRLARARVSRSLTVTSAPRPATPRGGHGSNGLRLLPLPCGLRAIDASGCGRCRRTPEQSLTAIRLRLQHPDERLGAYYRGPHLQDPSAAEMAGRATNLTAQSRSSKGAYAAYHGYRLMHVEEPYVTQAHPWMNKLIAIQQNLEAFDWLFWVDCDLFFMNPKKTVEQRLVPASPQRLGQGDSSALPLLRA